MANSKKMQLDAQLQQDQDEMQALKDKVRPSFCCVPVFLFFESRFSLSLFMCFVQAAQIKNVLATGAISGAQKLAQMAGKDKTQLQQTEAEVSSEQGSEHSMVERSVECRCV